MCRREIISQMPAPVFAQNSGQHDACVVDWLCRYSKRRAHTWGAAAAAAEAAAVMMDRAAAAACC